MGRWTKVVALTILVPLGCMRAGFDSARTDGRADQATAGDGSAPADLPVTEHQIALDQSQTDGASPVPTITVGGLNDDSARAVAVDSAGNIFVAGVLEGTVSFGPNIDCTPASTSTNTTDLFLAAFRPDGSVRWAHCFGGINNESLGGLAVDAGGNVYLTGGFAGSIKIPDGPAIVTLSSKGSYDLFVVSYSNAGKLRWIRSVGGTGEDRGHDLAVDESQGAVVVVGHHGHPITVPAPVNHKGLSDVLLASFGLGSGTFLWAKGYGTSNSEQGTAVAVNKDSIIFGGHFSSATNMGGSDLTSKGGQDLFLARVSKTGQYGASVAFGGPGLDTLEDLVVDAAGNTTFTGAHGGISFGGPSHAASGPLDFYIASVDNHGKRRWDQVGGGAGADVGYGVALSPGGNVYVTGGSSGSMSFGGATLPAFGSDDIFVARFSSAGQHQWSKSFGGPTADRGLGVALGSTMLYVVGEFTGKAKLGLASSVSKGFKDGFVIGLPP